MHASSYVHHNLFYTEFNIAIAYTLNNKKSDFRQSVDFTMAGFADALRPEKFSSVHFK
jgi:hypothetical protein